MENTEEIVKLPIPNEFRKEGMIRRLVKFKSNGLNDTAIYEVIKENWQFGTGHRGWEVLDIKYTLKDNEYYGKIIPKGSPILPSNEQFGKSGWHFLKWDSALKKFEERLHREKSNRGRKPSK